ncbi:MAG: UDP-N-acetylmuramoyl-L-alanyl-D-glutamate--2,6-diaminopimelate ligase [Bdellovibrionales bacterium]|nr:UDP-N-acetylmuramoyl-L-alanyl-D-glutamate--2,6-diaminopimelate ligase [Bdellovibrionales bacterium]
MLLAQLFSIYPQYKMGKNPKSEVNSISFNSSEVDHRSVFVAIKGTRSDGHAFLPQACAAGVAGVVVEDESNIPSDFSGAIVNVANSRLALSQLANHFYGYPCADLFCVGVTGTNGKTSTVYMIEYLLNQFSWSTGVLGTIDHHLGKRIWKSSLTTPDPVSLFKRMAEFKSLGAKAVAMEVSSHAIEQHRVHGIPFDVSVFTNLSHDHLDYHGTMEAYFEAKQTLFSDLLSASKKNKKYAIINEDDSWGEQIRVADGVNQWTFGESKGDFRYKIHSADFTGTQFSIDTPKGLGRGFFPMVGEVFLKNAVAAIATVMGAGFSLDAILDHLAGFSGVPGRLESVKNDVQLNLFVDYAHTPDALENVLKTLDEINKKWSDKPRNLVTVFGCGGDRDREKRPLMMKAAQKFSQMTFVTSDNPRNEDPFAIIQEIVKDVDKQDFDQTVFVEEDRRTAIQRAINVMQAGDVLLVAGKGHEDYQIVGQEVLPFSDVEVIKGIINEL